MYSYFETDSAIYSIYNGAHYIHLKAWDDTIGFKYHKQQISQAEYTRAYLASKSNV